MSNEQTINKKLYQIISRALEMPRTAPAMQNFSLELAERESEYMKTDNYRVFCGTFNVNGKSPTEDLKPWLFINQKQVVDIYAIGFQEIVDLNTTSFILQKDWLEREARWISAIDNEICNCNTESFNLKSFLGKKPPKYRRVVKYRMFGLLILIYVSEKIPPESVSEIFLAEVPTGILGTVGNKGSIGVSFKLNETRLCFICSHFASDTSQLQKRNADYRSTKQHMKFEYNANLDYYDLDNHDAVFWFGDLNYRLDKVSLTQTLEQIYSNQLEQLVGFDQLTLERERQNVFDSYNEGKISFRPTYKYVVGEDIHEMHLVYKAAIENNDPVQQANHNNGGVKLKLPSWTDRVLWKEINSKVELVQYSCINTITISDHKPVYALFDIEVKQIDDEKYNVIYNNLLKDSDKKINDQMPRISVDQYFCKFLNCKFYDQNSQYLTITNEGLTKSNVDIQFYDKNLTTQTNATSSFESEPLSQHQRTSQHKQSQWCSINPHHKERLEPNSCYKIQVTTNLNQHHLKRFNKEHNIDDFLIIRCLNGNDIFVTLNCEFTPSIIGFSLKTLSSLDNQASAIAFKEPELKARIEEIELKIEKFERNLNSMWLHSLKSLSSMFQIKDAERVFGMVQKNSNEPSRSSGKPLKTTFFTETNTAQSFEDIYATKNTLYMTLLLNLRTEIVDDDEYFMCNLSSEWTFFLEHLIERCRENLNLENANESRSSRDSSTKIEDQKNLILTLLTDRDFEKFRAENFDLELLAEVLYDLLYALPNPVIPSRFIDVFIYASNKYEDALAVFEYVARPHFKLFELLIKFLQIYLKCLASCNSGLNSLIANAIFKINPGKPSDGQSIISTSENLDIQRSQTANKLVRLFIDNHKKFKLLA